MLEAERSRLERELRAEWEAARAQLDRQVEVKSEVKAEVKVVEALRERERALTLQVELNAARSLAHQLKLQDLELNDLLWSQAQQQRQQARKESLLQFKWRLDVCAAWVGRHTGHVAFAGLALASITLIGFALGVNFPAGVACADREGVCDFVRVREFKVLPEVR